MVTGLLATEARCHSTPQSIVQPGRWLISLFLITTVLNISACSSIVSSASNRLADNVTKGLISQDDPEIARLGTPAYLVLIDGFIESDPGDAAMLTAGANMYDVYASAFVKDSKRSKRLTQKAFDYGRRALCLQQNNACDMDRLPHTEFVSVLNTIDKSHIGSLYSYTITWIGWIQAHRDNLNAVANMPKVQSALEHLLVLDETYKQGGTHMYLGVLLSLIPPSLGGKPDVAKAHFERAIELSEERNLMARVLYAEYYTRMLFKRSQHDELLKIVLKADPHQPGYTLSNVLAQERAKALLDGADDFF
jgi:tetratricopeptide (TPR) repeat protein